MITMLPQGVFATGNTNSLTEGSTYYFDLSNEGVPGTINDDLPDTTLHYVPFTYAGEITAYVLHQEIKLIWQPVIQNMDIDMPIDYLLQSIILRIQSAGTPLMVQV